jgi:REP element-mobilizing transposase RayT
MSKRGAIEIRHGANLPHWTKDGATYAATFRLADSLPQSAVNRLKLKLESIERKFARGSESLDLHERTIRSKQQTEAYMQILDECHGECLFRQEAAAEVVANALKHFDGTRYRLFAWCVMPNHVHTVVQPLTGHGLSSVLHSWKSFTANQVNRLLGRSGKLWQAESYDHLIRDEQDFAHHVWYVRNNPAATGLMDWKWFG